MLDAFVNMFSRKDPARTAQNCLARIITRFDMSRISYREGIVPDRRTREERNEAIGVWLFPQHENSKLGHFTVSSGVPAVTYDFRTSGMGILTPTRLKAQRFVVATPDETGNWQFFQCDVRHNTKKAGGWHLIGLQVAALLQPEGEQLAEFRSHTAGICDEE